MVCLNKPEKRRHLTKKEQNGIKDREEVFRKMDKKRKLVI